MQLHKRCLFHQCTLTFLNYLNKKIEVFFFPLPKKSILCLICPILVIFLLMFDTHTKVLQTLFVFSFNKTENKPSNAKNKENKKTKQAFLQHRWPSLQESAHHMDTRLKQTVPRNLCSIKTHSYSTVRVCDCHWVRLMHSEVT